MKNIFFLFCLCAILLVGCKNNPAPAKVNGIVTLDDKPVVGAEVIFRPVDGSRSSVGYTDDAGNYSLRFSASLTGAAVGDHTVTITTGEAEASGSPDAPKETIPAKYNKNTELTATLKAGKNTVNFALTTSP